MSHSKRFLARALSPLVLALVALLITPTSVSPVSAQGGTPDPSKDSPQISLDHLNVRDLQIDMGEGWTAQAEFTWPKEGKGPFPAVILFHGGCSCGSMDGAYWENPGDPIQMRNFRLLASELGKQGIAVMRFNRRGAKSDRDTDADQEGRFFGSTLRAAADGEAVLATLVKQPEADTTRIFLYGWSYGATVASVIAPYHSELKGLILQGAPANPSDPVQANYLALNSVVPYLTRVADKNEDGKLSAKEIYDLNIKQGPVWWIESGQIFKQASTADKPAFADGLDKNSDGLLDINTELIPYLKAADEGSLASNPTFSPEDTVAKIKMPVLILDGKLDGLIAPSGTEALAKAGGSRAILKWYDGLGHALSKITDPALDIFGPMEQQPINDIAAWILAQK